MMSENQLLLNGKKVAFKPGQTILQLARENGVDIPTLCYMKDATPQACPVENVDHTQSWRWRVQSLAVRVLAAAEKGN
jgi:predicted molibdopterin-dependent oxidoreductase YjgC